jgi:hypothetical protein
MIRIGRPRVIVSVPLYRSPGFVGNHHSPLYVCVSINGHASSALYGPGWRSERLDADGPGRRSRYAV